MNACAKFMLFAVPMLVVSATCADGFTQEDIDKSKTEYELCPKLAEYYQGGNPIAYLMLVDEIKKRGYGKKCLKIAEISMNLRKYELASAFREALKEISEPDHPVEVTRKQGK